MINVKKLLIIIEVVKIKKIILIGSLFVLILLIISCGNNDENSGMEDVTAQAVKTVDNQELQCPECEPCQECEVCEPQKECPECEPCPNFSENPIDIKLTKVSLVKPAESSNSKKTVYKLTQDEYNALEAATFYFEPRCDETDNKLIIEFDNKEVYNDVPECSKINEVNVDTDLLYYGTNIIKFKTAPSEDYRITNMELKSEFNDGTSDTQKIYDVRFERSGEGNEEEVESISDVEIRNYKEYEIDLSSKDVEDGLVLQFTGAERDGNIIVYANDELVYEGKISRRTNKIYVPKEYLEEGTNYFTFVGVGK
ncbi:hypothetical protein D6745_00030 [Candidatus Woesearchaeota archaeon]|nr:MAG: hypothetical protein D6745_00030 [Candidatus Woesearchaeota archaeon]